MKKRLLLYVGAALLSCLVLLLVVAPLVVYSRSMNALREHVPPVYLEGMQFDRALGVIASGVDQVSFELRCSEKYRTQSVNYCIDDEEEVGHVVVAIMGATNTLAHVRGRNIVFVERGDSVAFSFNVAEMVERKQMAWYQVVYAFWL